MNPQSRNHMKQLTKSLHTNDEENAKIMKEQRRVSIDCMSMDEPVSGLPEEILEKKNLGDKIDLIMSTKQGHVTLFQEMIRDKISQQKVQDNLKESSEEISGPHEDEELKQEMREVTKQELFDSQIIGVEEFVKTEYIDMG